MIPQAILPYVFHHLTYNELLQCSLVCKLWYRLTFDPLLAEKWKDINFQSKIQKLTKKYVEDSITVTSRLKKEEKMNWNEIFEKVLQRGKNHIQCIQLWSNFNVKQINLVTNTNFLNNLILLDLRGTNFDIKFLFEIELKGKQETNNNNNNNNNNYHHRITKNFENSIENEKNHHKEEINMKKNCSNNNKGNNDNEYQQQQQQHQLQKQKETEVNKNSIVKVKATEEEEHHYFLDLFKNLKYLYISGCQNATKEAVIKINQQWNNIILDVKICSECQEMTRICRGKALNASNYPDLATLSHCHVCKKSHCDHCRPLWTCETCGGDYTCQDCRAHGLTCNICDADYCYTCNHPKEVLECRYCHRMSCGQSTKCQNLGYLYKACDRCNLYVCRKCKNDKESLLVCSGMHCSRSFCKACINEATNTSLVSFDQAEVEKRIHENNFGMCSYCNKLFCIDCIDNNITFYTGTKDFSCTILLCKECETFYKTQLLNLFRLPQLSTSDYSDNNRSSDRIYNHASSSSSLYPNNLLTITPTNLITSRSLSIDSPIDIFNDHDHYIR